MTMPRNIQQQLNWKLISDKVCTQHAHPEYWPLLSCEPHANASICHFSGFNNGTEPKY